MLLRLVQDGEVEDEHRQPRPEGVGDGEDWEQSVQCPDAGQRSEDDDECNEKDQARDLNVCVHVLVIPDFDLEGLLVQPHHDPGGQEHLIKEFFSHITS